MVREAVRYFLRQGYAPEDMVVLTPYLGQLMELRAELAKGTQVCRIRVQRASAYVQVRCVHITKALPCTVWF